MKKKRITPQSAKAKGRNLQQYVCQKISDITGESWGSSGEDCPIESRPMGQSGTDVRMESHVLKMFPYSVECKAQESWNLHEFIKQAQTNILPDTDWLLVCKKSRENPVVILSREGFYYLTKKFEIDLTYFNYTVDSWRIDKWIVDAKNWGEPWVIFFSKKEGPLYCMLDAEYFFGLFGKKPMKRTKQ